MGSIPGSGRFPGGRHGNHSSSLAWRIPWTEEPGGLESVGSQEVDISEAAERSTHSHPFWFTDS